MNETELDLATDRLMRWVDYYLHCELDEEFQRDTPQVARRQLQDALREELLRAHANGLVAALTTPVSAGAADGEPGPR